MKAIVATILLIISLIGNVWLCTNITSLASEIHSYFDRTSIHQEYNPIEALNDIRTDFSRVGELEQAFREVCLERNQLQDKVWELESKIEQIQYEAEQAQKTQMYSNLLRLILSVLF